MEFIKYSSIENSYRQKFLDCIVSEGLSGGEWVVLEKAHGANFSFYVNKNKPVQAAKRNEFVGRNGCFYNQQILVEEYANKMRNVLNVLNAKEAIFYCEIFGGSYLHKDVPPVQNSSKVQKGVQYCPQNEILVYDILVDGTFLDARKVVNLCDHYHIPYLKILFSGSMEECLSYSNEFQTTIPGYFNLPPIENNICEGVVIKPVQAKFLGGGSRVILKNKNSKFSEKQKETKAASIPLDEELQKVAGNLFVYITENRLRNVLSHAGEVTNKDFGKILGAFNKDIFEEFQKENDNLLNTLEKADRKRIQKLVNAKGAGMIRNNFLNIVDGNF